MNSPVTELPSRLSDVPPERIVDLDVRDDLRTGREPFARILEARRALPADGVLRLRAIFEPYPLYRVMAGQGLDHWTEQLAEDDWRVWFFAAGAAGAPGDAPPSGSADGAKASTSGDAGVGDGAVVLDVRGLEPPEPMTRTLEALETLDPGATLVQINERIPRFLLPQLEERGFAYHIRQQAPDLVRVFIRRKEQS